MSEESTPTEETTPPQPKVSSNKTATDIQSAKAALCKKALDLFAEMDKIARRENAEGLTDPVNLPDDIFVGTLDGLTAGDSLTTLKFFDRVEVLINEIDPDTGGVYGTAVLRYGNRSR